MTGKFQVIAERLEAYTWKRGRGEHRVLVVFELSDTPLTTTADYVMTRDEEADYCEDLTGKILKLVVTEIRHGFGGRLRLQGRMQSIT